VVFLETGACIAFGEALTRSHRIQGVTSNPVVPPIKDAETQTGGHGCWCNFWPLEAALSVSIMSIDWSE